MKYYHYPCIILLAIWFLGLNILPPKLVRAQRATPSNASAAEEEAPEGEAIINDLWPDASASNATESNATESNATPADAQPLSAYGTVVDEESIIVYDYLELKQAISEDNGFTTIYLGSDIAADNSGTLINANKPYLVIDGIPPGAEADEGFTLTQYQSTNLSNTILLGNSNAATKEVVLKNLTVIGRNYYGVVATEKRDILIAHENIRYYGPQPVYNRFGTTRVTDSSYQLQQSGGIAVNELAETSRMEFAGTVDIRTDKGSTAAVVLLTEAASTVTFAQDATVTVDTDSYFINTGGFQPTVTLEPSAAVSLTSRRFGFTYAGQQLGTCILQPDSSLTVYQHTTESYAALRVAKLFQMQPGSSFESVRTGTNGIALLIAASGGRAEFIQPRRVVLHSSAGVPLRFTGQGTLSITAATLNVWKNDAWPILPSRQAMPDHIWNRAGTELLVLGGTYQGTTNTGLTHNLTAEDPVISELNATTFHLEKNKTITFGDISLSIDDSRLNEGLLSGVTSPQAAVSAVYEYDNAEQKIDGVADQKGTYYLDLNEHRLQPDSRVTVTAANDLLAMRQRILTRQEPEKLAFVSVPQMISFGQVLLAEHGQTAARDGSDDLTIEIVNTYQTPRPWRLDVRLAQLPAAVVNGEEHVLSNALFFSSDSNSPEFLTDQPLTIYREDTGSSGAVSVRWQNDQGILLRIPEAAYPDVKYQGILEWSLVSGP